MNNKRDIQLQVAWILGHRVVVGVRIRRIIVHKMFLLFLGLKPSSLLWETHSHQMDSRVFLLYHKYRPDIRSLASFHSWSSTSIFISFCELIAGFLCASCLVSASKFHFIQLHQLYWNFGIYTIHIWLLVRHTHHVRFIAVHERLFLI
jgi:hypothetical protein